MVKPDGFEPPRAKLYYWVTARCLTIQPRLHFKKVSSIVHLAQRECNLLAYTCYPQSGNSIIEGEVSSSPLLEETFRRRFHIKVRILRLSAKPVRKLTKLLNRAGEVFYVSHSPL